MTGPRRESQPASISIQNSSVDSSALAAGAGASAEVTVTGSRNNEATKEVLALIAQLRSELVPLEDADPQSAVVAAQASGQLDALEKEVKREPSRPEHLKGMLDGVVTTIGGLASLSQVVTALVTAVGALLA